MRRAAWSGLVTLGLSLVIMVTPALQSATAAPQAPAATAEATGTPPWWSGNCDVNNHPGSHQLGASYNGVAACGPGTYQGGTDYLVHFYRGAWGEYEWECVELVMRYMYLVYGVDPYKANGNTVVSNYSGKVFTKISNNGTSLPSPGDIVSMAGTKSNPDGHTAVVTNVNVSGGTGTVTVMEQNASAKGWGTIKVSGDVLGSLVTGWLHAPVTNPSSADLRQFYVANGAWTAFDVSAATGVKIAGNPMQGSSGSVWARDTSGDLRQFYVANGAWTAFDVSAATGVKIASDPMQGDSGGVWARDTSGDLRQFYVANGAWTAFDVSAATGVKIASDPMQGSSGSVWARDTSGDLRQFYVANGAWTAFDVSAATGVKIASDPMQGDSGGVWARDTSGDPPVPRDRVRCVRGYR